ncbi:hypothetical protein CMV_003486 [Castanea mollissima]|uniref:Uncharacterized protein n=1 Tax=Castanea mollissima TaxID=60419 RepID=A0A8J4W2Y8_9ROSI|nr:hypothetical protein CMV_003486 [Castanea mollissima]
MKVHKKNARVIAQIIRCLLEWNSNNQLEQVHLEQSYCSNQGLLQKVQKPTLHQGWASIGKWGYLAMMSCDSSYLCSANGIHMKQTSQNEYNILKKKLRESKNRTEQTILSTKKKKGQKLQNILAVTAWAGGEIESGRGEWGGW